MIISVLIGCTNEAVQAPTPEQSESNFLPPITGKNVEKDIKTLLPEGEFIVDVLDAVTVNPRYMELQARFMQAVEANKDWFLEQQQIMTQAL